MPDCNETIIRVDHDAKIAEVWTPNRRVASMMKRVDAERLNRQIDGRWWRVECRIGTRGIIFGKRHTERGFGARRAILPPIIGP